MKTDTRTLGRFLLIVVLVSIPATLKGAGDMIERRKAFLTQLLAMLPQDPAWNEWLNRTGELPPDFDALPTIMDLPDPLLLEENGKQVRISTKEQWERRRLFLKKQFEYYVTGRFPPPPGNVEASIVNETKDGEVTIRDVLLTFGPEHKAKLRVQPKSSIATLWACVWLARTHLRLVFDAGGTMLRVTRVPDLVTAKYTVLGWHVRDIVSTARQPREAHVALERYPGMQQRRARHLELPERRPRGGGSKTLMETR